MKLVNDKKMIIFVQRTLKNIVTKAGAKFTWHMVIDKPDEHL